jgi:hypothetical protein
MFNDNVAVFTGFQRVCVGTPLSSLAGDVTVPKIAWLSADDRWFGTRRYCFKPGISLLGVNTRNTRNKACKH